MFLSDKQLSILETVVKANPDGSFVDLDQLLAKINYETTKDSIHFSIRSMVKKGLIVKQSEEKRRKRRRRVLSATQLGYDTLKRLKPSPLVVRDQVANLLEGLEAGV